MPVKIIHVITRLDWGGSAVNTLLSARGLGGRYELKLAAGGAPAPGVIHLPRLKREISPADDIAAFICLYRLFRAERPDIVHTHTSKAGILGRWAAWAYRLASGREVRVIHSPHGHVFYGYFSGFKTGLFILAERLTAPATDVFIALTPGEKRESERFVPESRGKWEVVCSGVDFGAEHERLQNPEARQAARAARRAEAGLAPDAFVAGTAARLAKIKGVVYILEAARLLRGENIRFLIMGDGPDAGSLRRTAEKFGLDNVVFTGYRADIPEWLAALDVYLQPSLNEGMGRAIVEASASGLPVIGTRVCGIPDVVLDGRTGVIIPPADARALADAVLRLRGDKALRERMGSAGRDWVLGPDENGLPRFSVAAMIKKLGLIYDRT